MLYVISLSVGLLFGLGLCLSGMSEPAKVLGFLDLAGQWDPSLALVMGGAVAVGLGAFTLAKKRRATLLGGALNLPTNRTIDAPLVVGALIFGAGWGLAGICPAPGVVDVGFLEPRALVFVLAMGVGMSAYGFLAVRRPTGATLAADA